MKRINRTLSFSALALLTLLLPYSLLASPVIVRINDVPFAAPVVIVLNAPEGYDLYTGPGVADPSVEDGGLITLIGVDREGLIPDVGGRFLDPRLPADAERNAIDIIWFQHDFDGPFFQGDLQVGFNSAFPGVYYRNPDLTGDFNLGPVTNNWVTVYADDIIVVQFKADWSSIVSNRF